MNPFAFWNAILYMVERHFIASHQLSLPAPPPSDLVLRLESLPPHQAYYGQTRTGKSRYMRHIFQCVIEARLAGVSNAGAIAFDVHDNALFRDLQGWLALMALDCPEIHDWYIPIDPTNPNWTVRYNPFELSGGQLPEELASVLASTIMRVWGGDPNETPQLELVLENGFHTLIEAGLSLEYFERLLGDKTFRENILFELKNPVLDEYWSSQWYPGKPGREFREFVGSTIRRIKPLTRNRRVAEIFRSPASISFQDILGSGRIVLVNGAKGVLGRRAAYLFNALTLEEVVQAFFSRPEHLRRLVFVFCDEFHNYATESMDELLVEGAKYGCDLNLATQTIIENGKKSVLQERVFKSVSRIAGFRVAGDDADLLQREFNTNEIDQVKWVRENWQSPFGVDTLYEEPVFRSLEETREIARREILSLPNREFYFKVRGMGEATLLRTPDVPDIADLPNARHLPEALARLNREAFERFGVPRGQVDPRARRFGGEDFRGSLSLDDVPYKD